MRVWGGGRGRGEGARGKFMVVRVLDFFIPYYVRQARFSSLIA